MCGKGCLCDHPEDCPWLLGDPGDEQPRNEPCGDNCSCAGVDGKVNESLPAWDVQRCVW